MTRNSYVKVEVFTRNGDKSPDDDDKGHLCDQGPGGISF